MNNDYFINFSDFLYGELWNWFDKSHLEQFAMMNAKIKDNEIIPTNLLWFPPYAINEATKSSVTPNLDGIFYVINMTMKTRKGQAVIEVHTHPETNYDYSLSKADKKILKAWQTNLDEAGCNLLYIMGVVSDRGMVFNYWNVEENKFIEVPYKVNNKNKYLDKFLDKKFARRRKK